VIRRIFAGQIPDPRTRRKKGKVFWFFSSEKNRIFFCLTKKKQKDFISWCCHAGAARVTDARRGTQSLARATMWRAGSVAPCSPE
jgi:hypothetical protein